MVRKLLSALLGLFIALSLSAQNYKVSLQLQDASTGESVGFATVSLAPEKGQHKYTLSDSEGKATVTRILEYLKLLIQQIRSLFKILIPLFFFCRICFSCLIRITFPR